MCKALQKILCVLVAQLCPTLCNPWTVACQAPLFMEFSRQESWSGLPLPSPTKILRYIKYSPHDLKVLQ